MEQINFDKFFYELSLGWFYTEPMLFQVYLTHQLEKCTEMNCGIRSGQGKIQYNPEYLMNFSQKQVKDELKYELYRIMLRHPYRKKPYNADEALWFKASEITIKQSYLSTYGFEKEQSIEYYYEKLSGIQKKQDEENDENSQKAEGNSGDGSSDNSGDNSDEKQEKSENNSEGKNPSDKELENKSENKSENKNQSGKKSEAENNTDENSASDDKNDGETQNNSSDAKNNSSTPQTELWGDEDFASEAKLEATLENVGTVWGSVPSLIQREIQKLQIKPVLEFIQILKSFRSSVSFNQRRLTRMRPSRRNGFLRMGSKYELFPRILIAVDVSGSIRDEHLQYFFGTVSQIFKTEIKGLDVIQFDAAVAGNAVHFSKMPPEVTRLASGGTNFQCVIDYAAKKGNYDGLVIFTDGGAAEPKVPETLHTSILWMLFVESQKKEWMKKSGKVSWLFKDDEVRWIFDDSLEG